MFRPAIFLSLLYIRMLDDTKCVFAVITLVLISEDSSKHNFVRFSLYTNLHVHLTHRQIALCNLRIQCNLILLTCTFIYCIDTRVWKSNSVPLDVNDVFGRVVTGLPPLSLSLSLSFTQFGKIPPRSITSSLNHNLWNLPSLNGPHRLRLWWDLGGRDRTGVLDVSQLACLY